MKPSLDEIKKDLSAFRKRDVVVYGGYVKGFTPRSDIDIAILTRSKSPAENKKAWRLALGKAPDRYDIKIFELLPLHIKASVIKGYKVVFGDALDISEYVYHFASLWKDAEHRYKENQFSSFKEKIRLLASS